MNKPKALKVGDTVGLIAPASNTTEENVQKSIQMLTSLGFVVKEGKTLYERHGYLAGKDDIRAKDVNDMFADKEVDGIICIRGGSGCLRILDKIDYDIVRANPKVFVGYSDLTVLHIHFTQECDLVTFHGPMVSANMINDFDDFSRQGLLKMIFGSEDGIIPIENPAGHDLVSLNGGMAIGPLIGGCLSLVVSTLGTPYEIDTKGKILFLEDIGEEPYRIDRMLNNLRLAGKLDDAVGIILGDFKNCDKPTDHYDNNLSLQEVFEDQVLSAGKPTIGNLRSGHCKPMITLPFGVHYRLDADKKELHLLEKPTQ